MGKIWGERSAAGTINQDSQAGNWVTTEGTCLIFGWTTRRGNCVYPVVEKNEKVVS